MIVGVLKEIKDLHLAPDLELTKAIL